MNIVSVIGSPRGTTGATAALLKIVLEGAESQGAHTEMIAIKGQEVKPCRACDSCHKIGSCPQKDSFATIKEKIDKADGLVLASPNYIFQVSAQLKAFLDRCCGVVHCVGFEGKYGASVVTSGGGEEKPVADYMNQFLATTGVVPVGSVWATMGMIKDYEFPEDVREKAFSLGEKLVTAWKSKEKTPEYDRITSGFKDRMRSLMLWRQKEWPYEYRYWKEHHGLKS